jgi:hypothetical protein
MHLSGLKVPYFLVLVLHIHITYFHGHDSFFESANLGHHGGMMRGGGVGAEGEIGAGGDVFCSMHFLASINHGGRHHPTAAMRPHSQRRSIQQLANMLGNRLVLLKLGKVINGNVY